MLLDLAQLQEMHPKLPGDLALLLVTRAGLGLQTDIDRASESRSTSSES